LSWVFERRGPGAETDKALTEHPEVVGGGRVPQQDI